MKGYKSATSAARNRHNVEKSEMTAPQTRLSHQSASAIIYGWLWLGRGENIENQHQRK